MIAHHKHDGVVPPFPRAVRLLRRLAADEERRQRVTTIEQLANVDQRAARVVELRFFGGLTVEDVAEQLDISRKTACEDWAFARAWLSRRLGAASEGGA